MWYNERNKLLGSRDVTASLAPITSSVLRRLVTMNSISSCSHFVYELIDPRDDSIFYVGITINLYGRYKQHMQCDGTNPQKDARIQEILAAGHLPIMRTLECVASFEEARKQEKHWSWHYTVDGATLLNRDRPRFHYKPLRVQADSPIAISDHGREKTFVSVIDMLVAVHGTREWPENVSQPMRRYYKREYPEFFMRGKRAERLRSERIQKADLLRVQNRPSRSKRRVKRNTWPPNTKRMVFPPSSRTPSENEQAMPIVHPKRSGCSPTPTARFAAY